MKLYETQYDYVENLLLHIHQYAEGLPLLMQNGDDISNEVHRIRVTSKLALAEVRKLRPEPVSVTFSPVDYAADSNPCNPYPRSTVARE